MKCTRFFSVFSLFLVLAASSGCAPVTANRGNLLEDDRLAQIKVNESDKSNVESILGPATMVATFDKNTWYYSGKRTERSAFFNPETIAERTFVIKFNEAGIVQEVTEVSADTQLAIAPESRITPTTGRAMNALDQLIENASRPGLPGSAGRRQPGNVGGPGRVGR